MNGESLGVTRYEPPVGAKRCAEKGTQPGPARHQIEAREHLFLVIIPPLARNNSEISKPIPVD